MLVDLPKKHGRGGQSSVRFARLRVEKRHNYVRRVAELCTQFFINPQTSMVRLFLSVGLELALFLSFLSAQCRRYRPRWSCRLQERARWL